MKWQKAVQVVLAIFLLMPILTTNQTLAQDDQNGDFRILLKSREFTPPLGMGPAVEGKLKAPTSERVHVLLQFWRIPTEEEKKALEDAGVQLLAYIPHKAWFASIPTDKTATEEILTPAQAEGMLAVRWIGDIEPADKIALGIRESGVGPWALNDDGTVNLKVTFFKDVTLNEARQVIWAHDGTVLGESEAFNKLTVSMSATEIQSLAAEDAIQWIIEVPPPKIATNDGVRSRIGVNTVQNTPYDLDGTNVDVGIWDGGYVDINHDDFAGRLTIGDSGGSTEDHATHVGGTVGGDGTLSASQGGTALQWRGMAPNVDIISYEWNNNLSEHSGAIGTYGIELSQNSWGYEISRLMRNCYLYGNYTYDAPEYDDIVTGHFGKRIVVVFAAGNERDDCDCGMSCTPPYVNYQNVGPPSTAKNIISVGATNSDDDSMTTFSSWGPMDDGRIKPDVVAPGCEAGGEGYIHSTFPGDTYGGPGWCGTSMAAPATSGSAALLYQQFRSTYTDTEPLPSTIKGLLIHTAVDLGNTGPDYGYGYGRIDVQAAVDTIRAQELAEDSVTQGATDIYTITVSAGATALKMTLVWDDEPGAENANPALVNDLDLVLVDPNGTSHYPWVLDPSNPSNPATTGADHANNVEQVYVSGPMQGAWEARVSGYNVPYAPQDYSLIGISGELIEPSGPIYYLPIILKSPPLPDTLFAVEDAMVTQGYPTMNVGDTIDMWAGYDDYLNPDGEIVRSLIRFDLSDIPSGTSINSVSLNVRLYSSWDYPGKSRTITTYRIGSAWSESSVTWNTSPSIGEAYGSASVAHDNVGGWYSFDVTNLVRGWVNGSYSNYGVMLRGPEWSGSDSSWKAFYTSESSSDPYLAITYAGVTGSGEGPIKGALGSQPELPMVIELLDGDLFEANLCQDQKGDGQKCLTLPLLPR